MKSVLEVIQTTTAYFEKHAVESARLNIELLLAQALGLKRMELYLQFDRPLSDEVLEPLRERVRRRAAGEPLQHLLGEVEFLGRTFRCDKRALIPRPETEQLCEMLVQRAKEVPPQGLIRDIGTGSGVIALTLAAEWPEVRVEAIDLHPEALGLARENATQLGLQERVTFLEGDLLAPCEGEASLVVANLPYVAKEEIGRLTREVRQDPLTALDGGADGMDLIKRLIAQGPGKLRGTLALEIGSGQDEPVCAELRQHDYQNISVASDYQGHNRFVFASYG